MSTTSVARAAAKLTRFGHWPDRPSSGTMLTHFSKQECGMDQAPPLPTSSRSSREAALGIPTFGYAGETLFHRDV